MPWDSTPRILPTLMVKGGFAGFGGQAGARQDERHLVAGLEILRPADDLPHALAVIHHADGELVGIGVLVLGDDLGDDHALELAAELLNALDLDAEHGQPLGQFGSRPVELDVLFEPVESDFHGGSGKCEAPLGLRYGPA